MSSFENDPDFEDTYEGIVSHQLKTPEEIKKFAIDESLSPLQRFYYILDKGQEIQVVSALSGIVGLLKKLDFKEQESFCKRLSSCLPKLGEEANTIACEKYPILLKEKCVSMQIFFDHLFPMITNGMQGRTSSNISQAWTQCLLDCIPFLSKDQIRKEILPLAQKRSNISQTVQTRISACHIISKMVQFYDQSLILQDLISMIKLLCQDIEYDVRWNMCINLIPIASKLGVKTTVSTILPEIVELTNDEEKIVKYKALDTIIEIVPHLDDDSIMNTVVPIINNYLENISLKHDSQVVDLSKVFGKICYQLHDHLSDEQRIYYISFFRKLSSNGLSDSAKQRRRDSIQLVPQSVMNLMDDKQVECRTAAAYNFPALASFCGSGHFKEELEKTLLALCTDPSLKVRKTISAGFHEIVKILVPKAVCVETHLLLLLKDEDLEIKATVIKHLDIILLYLYDETISDLSQKAYQDQILDAILGCYDALRKSTNWRATCTLIKHFTSFPQSFSAEVTYHRIYPLLYQLVTSHAARPIRLAACESLAWLLRCNKHYDQRHDMISSIIKHLAHGDSCAKKLMFIQLCHCFAKQFSRSFFKLNFMEPILELSQDSVLDVRLALSKMLPFLKSMLKLPADRALLQKLELAVRKLLSQDKLDGSLTSTIRNYVHLCDKQEVMVESAIDQLPRTEEDRLDQQKEEEEKLIAFHHESKKRRGTVGSRTGNSFSKKHNPSLTNPRALPSPTGPGGPPLLPSSAAPVIRNTPGPGKNTLSSPSPSIMSSPCNNSNSSSPKGSTPNGFSSGRRGSMPPSWPATHSNNNSKRIPTPDKKPTKKV